MTALPPPVDAGHCGCLRAPVCERVWAERDQGAEAQSNP
jgi:hypothetical protein